MLAAERETVINATDADDVVRIWTAQRTAITLMRKHPAFTEIRNGTHDSSVWAEFEIPADQWNVTRGAKRRLPPPTDEERAARVARAARMRVGKLTGDQE